MNLVSLKLTLVFVLQLYSLKFWVVFLVEISSTWKSSCCSTAWVLLEMDSWELHCCIQHSEKMGWNRSKSVSGLLLLHLAKTVGVAEALEKLIFNFICTCPKVSSPTIESNPRDSVNTIILLHILPLVHNTVQSFQITSTDINWIFL